MFSICFFNANAQQGKPINICSNLFDEFAPSISADGKTLIFQSNKDGEYKLYESKLLSKDKWSDPLPITNVNTFGKAKDLVAGPNISYDGNTLFFCASYASGYGDLDIYYSERKGEVWTKPINLGKPVNSSDYEGFPSVSADGTKLYFTRILDKKIDGLDCFKIMVTQKGKDGKWMAPKELPMPVNSGCDKAPRIMSDGKTLYFASFREGGKGKFDLYTTKLSESGEWQEPVGLDFVNSPEQEQYSTVPASGDYLYYHSYNNIQQILIPFKYRQNRNIAIQGYITDFDTKNPLEAVITIKDALTSEVLSSQASASDGRYTVVLTEGRKYEVVFSKDGYSVYTMEYDATKLADYKEYEINVSLFTRVTFELSVTDYELYFPIDAEITVKNGATNEIMDLSFIKTNHGSRIYDLPLNKKYVFEIKAPKYADYTFTLDLTNEIRFKQLEKEVEMSPFKKQINFEISDSESGSGLMVDFIVTNLDMDEQFVVQASVTRDGKYALSLREGHRYNVEVKNQKGYAFSNQNIEVNKNSKDVKISLTALKPGAKLLLKEITFEYNSYELKDNSMPEINRIIELIKSNPKLVIEVAAHTDGIGSDVFNNRLSELRAKNVFNYITNREINPTRLKPVGYGKAMPIASNETEEGRAKNRRLELKIVSN
ncbi:MAG: OmpA family protein [Bacteroidota bacterium]|nr:OmpA family protein [Bacteroidota bacterium]